MAKSTQQQEPPERIAIPCNPEAEEAVLGSMLIDPDAVINVAPLLAASDFYREKNGWIYQVMLDLSEKKMAADFVTVCDELERRDQMVNCGGTAYVTSLITAVASAAHAVHYAGIVARMSVLRKVIVTASHLAGRAYEQPEDVDALLDWAAGEIFKLSEKRVQGTLRPAGDTMQEVIERIGYLAEHPGETTGIQTGLKGLDNALGGLQDGDLVILAARPGQGKSALAMNAAVSAAKNGQARVAVFSMEMATSQLLQRMLSTETGVALHDIRNGKINQDEWPLLLAGADVLSQMPLYIDDTPNARVLEVRAKARRMQAELGGIDLIVVDYLQLMAGDGKVENRQQEISLISRQMKSLAREMNCPVLCLSQMSRAVEQRADKTPVLSDLRESGAIEQDADVVMFIKRENGDENADKAGLADVIIAKFRNGATGKVPLFFDGTHTRFADIEQEKQAP
jgi:replicative DNA helicase